MAEATVFKLCTQKDHLKSQPWNNKLPTNGRGQGHATYV